MVGANLILLALPVVVELEAFHPSREDDVPMESKESK